jgi:hypothetical protein
VKEYFLIIRIPAVLIIINSILWHFLDQGLSDTFVVIVFNLFRCMTVAWAGWLLIKSGRGLAGAALAGVILFFFDHPVVTGMLFIIQGELQAFFGVLISFVMFAIVAALVGIIGGLFSRIYHDKHP